MRNRHYIFILLVGFVFFVGCPQTRDHVFKKRGYVNVGVMQGFGQGEAHENYIECKDDVYVFLGDHISDVISKLGNPDMKTMTMDGIEEWTYDEFKIRIFLESRWVKGWERF